MVRTFPYSLLAGAAAVLTAAAMTPAMAGDNQVHVMSVQLPGGGIEHIQYTGDVAPRIVLVPTSSMTQDDPFAALARISAMMQQQEAMMLHRMQMLQAEPLGVGGASFVSATPGSGVCVRSVRITYNGGNAAPNVVSSTSGDCGLAQGAEPGIEVNVPAPINIPAPKSHKVPNTIEVKAGQTPGGALARQVAWNR